MQSGRRLPWQRRKHKDSCHYSITLHKAIVLFQWENEAANSILHSGDIRVGRLLIIFANGLDSGQAWQNMGPNYFGTLMALLKET